MPKLFRVVPIGQGSPTAELTITADTDFDAFMQAKQALGAGIHFDLWEGRRRALSYNPPVGTTPDSSASV